jgi:putative nucleotidyltransferase with HDIG domain
VAAGRVTIADTVDAVEAQPVVALWWLTTSIRESQAVGGICRCSGVNEWRRAGGRTWLCGWVLLVALQLSSSRFSDRQFGSPSVLFWLVVVAASGCVATATWLLIQAFHDDAAELGLIAVYFFGVSVLPLVHGLTTPGVIYGPNEATMTAVLWALPIASIAALPLLTPRSHLGLLRYWRVWVAVHVCIQVILAIGLLVSPSLFPFAAFGDRLAVMIALGSILPSVAFSARHLRLYRISRRRSVLAVALAFALVAAANLVWVNGAPMTVGFWLAHVLDIAGVFAATIVGAIAYRRDSVDVSVLRPLTIRNPLDALEFGLDPVVREFMTDLGRKDVVTREHVKRTAEAAIAVGEELGLPADSLRQVGLGALLHDIGKLRIDDAVLTKPGRLTPDEFEHIKQHTVLGEQLVRSSVLLHDVAPIVRHHHERIDGRGYPDGLAGEEIPLLARIVSVCDAFDAMAHTRQYRQGMQLDDVRAVLLEHSGSQWDPHVVDALLRAQEVGRVASELTSLAGLGICDCADDLPVPSAYVRC